MQAVNIIASEAMDGPKGWQIKTQIALVDAWIDSQNRFFVIILTDERQRCDSYLGREQTYCDDVVMINQCCTILPFLAVRKG